MYLKINKGLLLNAKSIDEVRAIQNKNSDAYHIEISANGKTYRLGYYSTANDAYKDIVEVVEQIGDEVYDVSWKGGV